MSWAALISALVAFFEPLIQQWLTDLLKKIEDKLAGTPGDPALAIHDVFSAARAKLTLWDRLLGRARAVDAAQRVAMARAAELTAAAAKGWRVPVMTTAEYDAVKNLA